MKCAKCGREIVGEAVLVGGKEYHLACAPVDAAPFNTGRAAPGSQNALREAAFAAQDEAPAVPVVKALEWRNGYRDENVTIVQASFGGLYQVRTRRDGIWLDWPDRRASVQFDTLDAAKAAAQADFETRIRSALFTRPAAADAGVREDHTYGLKLIAEAIEAHFGERVENYDEYTDDTSNHDAWEAFDALAAKRGQQK